MFSTSSTLFARTWCRNIFLATALVTAALANTSARGAASDSLEITYADGSPVIAHNGISVDYKIGAAATVTLQDGDTLGKLELPEPALESTVEGRVVVNINGYLTLNETMMIGLGSKSAYLFEPPAPPFTTVSDIMQCVTRENSSNRFHRDFEFTLISDSDPAVASANPLQFDLKLPEDGTAQDLSTGLFTATPGQPLQVTAPFHVFVTSDLDLALPEPASVTLLGLAGLALLKPHRRPTHGSSPLFSPNRTLTRASKRD